MNERVSPPVIVGVAGGSGSGKTTIANAIYQRLGADKVAYIPHDAYYYDLSHLPPEERARQNFDHPDSLETPLLVQHLKALRQGYAVNIPIYDFATHTRLLKTRRVEPRPIILVEGILVLAERALRDMMDIKIFVDTDADIRFIRRLQRDIQERGRTMESVINQYLGTVRPMHLEFVEPSKRYADIIIPEGGFNTVALDMVIARLRNMIQMMDRPDDAESYGQE
ncbi:MAG: uridine kinase [Chloroflexi bacterium]|nr:uridine kinase [Chloroflexota bacterium]